MAAEAMFRKGLPSSVMSKIDNTEEEKLRRKKQALMSLLYRKDVP